MPYLGGVEAPEHDRTGVVRIDRTLACPGYRLYCVQMLGLAELIDVDGRVVRQFGLHSGLRFEQVRLLADGKLLAVAIAGSSGKDSAGIRDQDRQLLCYRFDGTVEWRRRIPAHHDVILAPNGLIVTLSLGRRNIPELDSEIPIRDDRLLRLEPDGALLDERSLLDAIRAAKDRFPLLPVKPTASGGAPWIDALHANSIQWISGAHGAGNDIDPENDAVLVCFRNQNRVALFDWQTNRVLWAIGAGLLDGPHDAQVLPHGNVLVFDNGLQRGFSRGLEIDPKTQKVVWSWQADPPGAFHTASKGSIQRLPNGNTLLAESDRGLALEVTASGTIVWEFVSPHRLDAANRAAIVRMKWISSEIVDPLLASAGR